MKENLNFYKKAYNQIEKIEKLYKNTFSLIKIKSDILLSNCTLNKQKREEEYQELVALESVILATLIGLNREKLEKANSEVDGRNLFQYKGYESDLEIFYNNQLLGNSNDFINKMCKSLNFNGNNNGPFPYMLEIITDNDKNRPYDYMSKIRNALVHGEYYLENAEILNIKNHDEDGNLIFEGKLLLFPFEIFVIDFFGINSVNSSLALFDQINIEKFKTDNDIVEFLFDFTYYDIKFTKISSTYKFIGKDALYSRLYKCFDLNSKENKDISNELLQLKNEGFDFNITKTRLTKDQIKNICEYLFKRYSEIYNNEYTVDYLSSLLKLQLNPMDEITNCLQNILTYISIKKDVLLNNNLNNINSLNQLIYDEYCDIAFIYSLNLLKTNIINYAIECSSFENIDFSLLDTSNFIVDDKNELQRRKNKYILEGLTDNESRNKVILETIRNSLAHGAERINVLVEKDLQVKFTDIYPNVPNLSVTVSLKDLNNVLYSYVFKPENIKLKDDSKILKK